MPRHRKAAEAGDDMRSMRHGRVARHRTESDLSHGLVEHGFLPAP
jgi:hypothetical protein